MLDQALEFVDYPVNPNFKTVLFFETVANRNLLILNYLSHVAYQMATGFNQKIRRFHLSSPIP
jgi:hypothetical protein